MKNGVDSCLQQVVFILFISSSYYKENKVFIVCDLFLWNIFPL